MGNFIGRLISSWMHAAKVADRRPVDLADGSGSTPLSLQPAGDTLVNDSLDGSQRAKGEAEACDRPAVPEGTITPPPVRAVAVESPRPSPRWAIAHDLPPAFVENVLYRMMDRPAYTVWTGIYTGLIGALGDREIIEAESKEGGFAREAGQWLRTIGALEKQLGCASESVERWVDKNQIDRVDWRENQVLFSLVFRQQQALPPQLGSRYFDWNRLPEYDRLDSQQIGCFFAALQARGQMTAQQSALLQDFMQIPGRSVLREKEGVDREWGEFFLRLESEPDFKEVCLHFSRQSVASYQQDADAWKKIISTYDFAACQRRIDALTAALTQLEVHSQKMLLCLSRQENTVALCRTQRNHLVDRGQAKTDVARLKVRLREGQKLFYHLSSTIKKGFQDSQVRLVDLPQVGRAAPLRMYRETYRQELFDDVVKPICQSVQSLEAFVMKEKNIDHCLFYSLGNTSLQMVTELTDVASRLRCAGDRGGCRLQTDQKMLAEVDDLVTVLNLLEQERGSIGFLAGEVWHFGENHILYHDTFHAYRRLKSAIEDRLKELASKAAAATSTLEAERESASSTPPRPGKKQQPSPSSVPPSSQALKESLTEAHSIERAFRYIDQGEATGWRVVNHKRAGILSADTRRLILDTFDKGTFATPLRSCIYHFLKHTRRCGSLAAKVDDSSVSAYVRDARQALERSDGPTESAWTYHVQSTARPDHHFEVVNSPRAYLVRTPGTPPRVVSFRNREQYGL